jgi:hypothetical protein
MAERRNVREEVPTIVNSLLQTFSKFWQGTDDGDLLSVFSMDAKATVDGLRAEGPGPIVNLLRKKNREFSPRSYSVLLTEEDRLITSGSCLWGNEKHWFTFAFEVKITDAKAEILFVNLMMI